MLSAGSEREAKAGAGGGQLERAHQAAGGGERQAQVRGLLPQVGHFSWISVLTIALVSVSYQQKDRNSNELVVDFGNRETVNFRMKKEKDR